MQNGSTRSIQGARVLVTGAAGFIGKHLTARLLLDGVTLATLDRVPSPNAASYVGDLRDFEFLSRSIGEFRPSIIFHLAALRHRTSAPEAFAETIEINLFGTLNLFRAAAPAGVEALIVMGTAEEYGHNPSPFLESMREQPITAYSFSKACTTQLSRLFWELHGLPIVVLRPTVAYGPGQGVDMFLPALIQSLIAGKNFAMTSGDQMRDFLFVSDLVDGLMSAASARDAAGKVINLGSGSTIRIATLAEKVKSLIGGSGAIRRGALPLRPGEIMNYAVDLTQARAVLGWSPKVSLDQGLALTIRSYRGD